MNFPTDFFISKLNNQIREHENNISIIVRRIKADPTASLDKKIQKIEDLCVRKTNLEIRHCKLLLMLGKAAMKNGGKIDQSLFDKVTEKIKKCIEDKMELLSESVEEEALNENQYLQSANSLKKSFDSLLENYALTKINERRDNTEDES